MYNISVRRYYADKSGCGAAGSALDWGSRGRKFKSCHSDHQKGFPFYAESLLLCHFSGLFSPVKLFHICPVLSRKNLFNCIFIWENIFIFWGRFYQTTHHIMVNNYSILISLFAASTVSWGSPNEDNLKYFSPHFPNPAPGVPTICALFNR